MRILIHSNDPQLPTGYAGQTAILAPLLQRLGHDVAISAFYGASTPYLWGPTEIPIFPQGQTGYGLDVLLPHAETWRADVIIPLMDFWKLTPIAPALKTSKFVVAPWLPIDCTPLGHPDQGTLAASGAIPIAMSQHGVTALEDVYHIDPLYAPHAVDTTLYHPNDYRTRNNVFTVGMVAANRDAIRKAFPEQLRAFASFHEAHPKSRLILHTEMVTAAGHNLYTLCEDVGLDSDTVTTADQYRLTTGQYDADDMRELYTSLDLLLAASCAEGFGIPLIEAAACGVPGIYTEASAMVQTGHGWGVGGERWYNPVHRAWWVRPSHKQLRTKLDTAYRLWDESKGGWNAVRDAAVTHAAQFSIPNVEAYWGKVMTSLEGMFK